MYPIRQEEQESTLFWLIDYVGTVKPQILHPAGHFEHLISPSTTVGYYLSGQEFAEIPKLEE